jgi:hypothetical protein
MRHPLRSRASSLLLAASLAACSSAPAPVVADAGSSDATAADAPAADAPAADAPAADAGAGACEDFSGAYTLTGTCSVPGFSPFPSACIAQTGCSARIVVTTGPTTGTVVGNRMTFTSMVSGIALSCVATRGGGGALSVVCDAGGLARCDAVSEVAAFPGAARFCCDPSAQDCGAGQRCNLVGAGPNNAVALTACVPEGAVASGDACVRADGRLGADQCARGLTCVNFGQAMVSQRACQPLCRSTADCTGGAACIVVSDAPRAGVCRAPCEVLGTNCPAGTCRHATSWGAADPATAPAVTATTCQPVGTAEENATCAANNDCAANLTCARRTGADPLTCRRICDATHPCPTGTACSGAATATDPVGAGACLPPA